MHQLKTESIRVFVKLNC